MFMTRPNHLVETCKSRMIIPAQSNIRIQDTNQVIGGGKKEQQTKLLRFTKSSAMWSL